jgi:hypothetical protein
MRVLIVYESMFGNTREIAEAVAEGLRAGHDPELVEMDPVEVGVVEVGEAPATLADVDLLVVGGPTHALGMSRPETRQSATEHTDEPLVSGGPGIREWLGGLAKNKGAAAAAFDTKVDKPWVPGSASGAAGRRLRKLGYHLVVPPTSFLVDGITGPLDEAETTRARRWGGRLAATVVEQHEAGV